jgi:hypothetical protein
MFLGRKSRDRMIGLVGAYAVLIAGVVYTGAIDSAPAVALPVEAAPNHRSAERPDDSLSSRQQRADIFC